jgi:hypothetical protein
MRVMATEDESPAPARIEALDLTPAVQRTRTIDLNAVGAMMHAAERQLCDDLWMHLQRLRAAGLDDGAVFVLPHDLFPLLTRIFDRPVVRGGVDKPMIAIPGA